MRQKPMAVAAMVIAQAVALAACSTPPVPADHFYRLNPAAPAANDGGPAIAGSLAVARPRTDGLASQRPLLFSERERPFELKQMTYHYWTDSPSRLLQDVLVEALARAGTAATVFAEQPQRAAGCRLDGEIRRFEHVIGGGDPPVALIEVDFRLERSNDHGTVFERVYRVEQPAAEDSMDATVQAFDTALAAIIARLVADLAGAQPQCPAPAA